MLLNNLKNLTKKAKICIEKSKNVYELEKIRIMFLGKKGYVNKYVKILNSSPTNLRPQLGNIINQAKTDIKRLLAEKNEIFKKIDKEEILKTEMLDVTLPGRRLEIGKLHPITTILENLKNFFKNLGFTTTYGKEIENSYYNFDALNIPDSHPARDDHDTFWFDQTRLLRTHTSGIQIRIINEVSPPIRIISYGRVYRKDYDKNHTPMFHQLEGLMIDSGISFSHLKGILYNLLQYLFDKNITLRFRPSYFPFTEPSAEIDIMTGSGNWLEILGCGMVKSNILSNAGINIKKFSGFAFGIGIERLAMIFYKISDLRNFFENDLRFLNQFI